jgi:PAS domain-containing protein
MNVPTPLPLTHSWPIYEAGWRLPPGALASSAGPVVACDVGLWSCTLDDNRLSWTAPVYALFGIPPGEALTRSLAVSLYLPRSRAAMEELRAHAIRHKRGFTLDAQIRRPDGDVRWMRLSALPVLAGKVVERLIGTKQDVTAEYDGGVQGVDDPAI